MTLLSTLEQLASSTRPEASKFVANLSGRRTKLILHIQAAKEHSARSKNSKQHMAH